MNLQEVSDILGLCRFLRAPKHIFITDEEVCDYESGSCFRGLQPTERGDVIFLSKQADSSTVPHEAWHAQTGLGEMTAYPIGKLASLKCRLLNQLPKLKSVLRRDVKYRPAGTDDGFEEAQKYGDRVQHYVRVDD